MAHTYDPSSLKVEAGRWKLMTILTYIGVLTKEFHILAMSTRIENIPPFVIAQKYLGVSVRKHVLHPALHTDSLFRVSH